MARPRNYDEAMAMAEKCYDIMERQAAICREQERLFREHLRPYCRQHWWQFWRPTYHFATSIDFETAVERRILENPLHRLAAGDAKWFMEWARAYGQGESLQRSRDQVPVRPPDRSTPTDGTTTPPPQRVQRS